MKKCFGRLAGIFWIPAVMGMIVCGVQTMVYAADVTACAADMAVHAADTTADVADTSVYAADTSVYAIDIKKNTVFQVSTDVGLHEAPDTTSAVTAVLPGGTPVIVKEDAADGWCKVAYREQAGYVQVSFLDIVGSPVASVTANDQQTPGSGQPDGQAVQNEGAHTDELQSGKPVQGDQAVQSGNVSTSDNKTQPGGDLTANSGVDALDDEFRVIQEQNLLSYQEAQTAKEQAKSDRIWGIVITVLVTAIFAVGIVTTLKGKRSRQ